MRVESDDRGIEKEIWEFFTFMAPNHKHNPKFKAKVWDGKIRLYHIREKLLHRGLLTYIQKFCEDRKYRCILDFEDADVNFSLYECEQFLKTLHLPANYEIRDYQVESITHCIRKRRVVFLSPTASGKSFIIYALLRFYNKKTILIVPSTNLVEQMFKDFKEYSAEDPTWNVELRASKVMAGKSKIDLNQIVITTWQSAILQPPEWFEDYDIVMVDEGHEAKAASIRKIMDTLTRPSVRLAFTGTLDDIQVHQLVLEGMFGPIKQVVKTFELIDQEYLSKIDIKVILLRHDDESKKHLARKENKDYESEFVYLIGHEDRNEYIAKLAVSLKGNVLVLYQRVDTHGKILYDKIIKNNSGQNIHLIHGKVNTDKREEIRGEANNSRNNIIVASYGTYQRGINIVNLDYVIFAFPSRSRVRNLQSIGRGLRLGTEKSKFVLFDIADDLVYNNRKNHTYKHLEIRLKLYLKERFQFTLFKVKLK